MAKEEKKLDEQAAGDEDGEGGKKGGSKKLLIIIILAVVLVAGGGAGAFFFLMNKPDEVATEETAEAEEGAPAATATGTDGAPMVQTHFYTLPELTVNLAPGGDGAQHFLRLKLTAELNAETDVPRLEAIMPRIIDDYQLYLRQLRIDDLQGSAGVIRLKEALLMRANQAAQPLQINDILFTEFIIQ